MRDVVPPPFTLGVEEEYQIVDAETLALRPRADRIVPAARRLVAHRHEVQPELVESQVEIGTPVCSTLDDVRASLLRLRAAVGAAAASTGSRVAAMGTHPFTGWVGQTITPGARYERLAEDFQQLAREQLICGCHVHVAVPDAELRIHVMDRVRVWLPVVLAVAANSPFWMGVDSGYASWRCEVFGRFPVAGLPPALGSRDAFDTLVRHLQAIGVVQDASFVYWDVRPSMRFDTVEFRVADVCSRVDDAVLVAALCRSLARTAASDVDRPAPDGVVLRAARWHAARYGLEGDLVDLTGERGPTLRPAAEVVSSLLDHLRDDLEAHGEWEEVSALTDRVLRDGNGASRQRGALERRGSLEGVVREVIEETAEMSRPTQARRSPSV